MMESGHRARKQCFTSIQSRKLVGNLEVCQLCPSMDLVNIGTTSTTTTTTTTNASSSLQHQQQQQNLYRTMSWQKVATITPNLETIGNDAVVSNTSTTTLSPVHKESTPHSSLKRPPTTLFQEASIQPSSPPSVGGTTTTTTTNVCWSPSGRWIAVARGTSISLYGVELLANPPVGSTSFGGSNLHATEAQHTWTLHHPVTGLSWAHVGRAHPTAWVQEEDDLEEEIAWGYQSQYVDKSKFFLPPSAYLQPSDDDEHHRHQEGQTTTTALPECKTPLSVLCVSTTNTLELYLHGLYPLMAIDRPTTTTTNNDNHIGSFNPRVVVSNDLSYFLVQSDDVNLSLYHLPFLKEDRYPLQVIASLHASIMSHLATLEASVTEVLNSWKSSLKPLDTKLQPLLRLLENYGVDDQPLGVIIKQYILVGHTSESSSVANAIDQFFTSVQMNDQLLQRMERSLHSALANVESQARKVLLSPMQAVCYQIQELAGHVGFHVDAAAANQGGEDEKNKTHQQALQLQQLLHTSYHLWISVETLILNIVKGRFQVQDFCGWLRSAGSQIKARGTAPNSVQRENAKKRRVAQAVIERLLSSLNTDPAPDQNNNKTATMATTTTSSLSEYLLNIKVSSTLIYDGSSKSPQPTRPPSPTSVVGLLRSPTLTVSQATQFTLAAAKAVLVDPLSNIPKSLEPKEFRFPFVDKASVKATAIHTRIGRDVGWNPMWDEDDDDDSEEGKEEMAEKRSYFAPRAFSGETPDSEVQPVYCRQWMLMAQAYGNIIQLFAIPLGAKGPPHEREEGNQSVSADLPKGSSSLDVTFYLTTKLVLPSRGHVRDIGFYSDDGKSSLSSGNDSGTGKEGRQKFGILYQEDENDGEESKLQLWLTEYDSFLWQRGRWERNNQLMRDSQVLPSATVMLTPMLETNNDNDDDGNDDESIDEDRVLKVPTRLITTFEGSNDDDDNVVRLLLCGSRGVGGVAWSGSQGIMTLLEVLDLEEDEEHGDEEVVEEDQEQEGDE